MGVYCLRQAPTYLWDPGRERAHYSAEYRPIRPYSSLILIHFRRPSYPGLVSSLYVLLLRPCDSVSQVTLTQQHLIPSPQACPNPKHSTNAPLNHNHPDSIVSAEFPFSVSLPPATALTLMTRSARYVSAIGNTSIFPTCYENANKER